MWSKFRYDTPESLTKSFNLDFINNKVDLTLYIKSDEDIEKSQDVLTDKYELINVAFKTFQSLSVNDK